MSRYTLLRPIVSLIFSLCASTSAIADGGVADLAENWGWWLSGMALVSASCAWWLARRAKTEEKGVRILIAGVYFWVIMFALIMLSMVFAS